MSKTKRMFRLKRARSFAEPEPSKRDFPLIRSRILAHSESTDFEEARREWEYTKKIEETDPEFVDHCEICNNPIQKENFEITNVNTRKTYLVGSTCIYRFIIFKGTQTQEESNALFDRQIKKQDAAKRLQRLLPSILTEPTPTDLLRFSQTSKFIMECSGNLDVTPLAWENYLKLLFGAIPKTDTTQRISTAVFNPKEIKTKKVAMPTGQKEGKWADVTKVKKTRIDSTLSRSGAYRVGKDDPEKK